MEATSKEGGARARDQPAPRKMKWGHGLGEVVLGRGHAGAASLFGCPALVWVVVDFWPCADGVLLVLAGSDSYARDGAARLGPPASYIHRSRVGCAAYVVLVMQQLADKRRRIAVGLGANSTCFFLCFFLVAWQRKLDARLDVMSLFFLPGGGLPCGDPVVRLPKAAKRQKTRGLHRYGVRRPARVLVRTRPSTNLLAGTSDSPARSTVGSY